MDGASLLGTLAHAAPRGTPGWLSGLTRYIESGSGSDDEQAPLTPVELRKSPSEVFREDERRTRRRILCCASVFLLLYMLVGIWAYGYALEKWGPVRALYFTIATLTTVGFGNLSPTSPRSRLFTTCFAMTGILIDALAVSELLSYVQEQHYQHMQEWNRSFANALATTVGSTELLQPLMRRAKSSSWYNFCGMLYTALMPLVFVNVMGVGAIGAIEGWGFIDMFYYAVMTTTTTGYGDLHPTRTAAFAVAIVYFPMAAWTVAKAVSTVAGYWLERAEEARRAELLHRAYTWEGLFDLDADSDGSIGRYEFTIYFLKLWGMADEGVIKAVNERFKELDSNGSGRLTKGDFQRRRRGGAAKSVQTSATTAIDV